MMPMTRPHKSIAPVSAVVCTCNRGDLAATTVTSLLANDHPDFEVILIDQSADDVTARAVAHFRADRRFRYVPTATRGLGRARNIGIAIARHEIIAFTDDDCITPPNWLTTITAPFAANPRLALVFSNVEPGPHDPTAGFIPAYQRRTSRLVRTLWDKCYAHGIGAGLAVRRAAITAMGGFDEALGAGARFPSCEDGDIAVRALLHNWWIYETHEAGVVHNGFRTWHEGKELTKRDWIGIGAAYAKPLKCGHWRAASVVAYEGLFTGLLLPLAPLLRLKRPQGLRRGFYFWQGFVQGWRTPVDRQRIVYQL